MMEAPMIEMQVAQAQFLKEMSLIQMAILFAGYIFLFITSGKLVNYTIHHISTEVMPQPSREVRDTGFVIGKCENLLLLTFMMLDAYTALALIFTAKAIVRAEDMKKQPLYFLAGTMVNVTYSIMIGLILKIMITRIN
jgi:hypothetical protein